MRPDQPPPRAGLAAGEEDVYASPRRRTTPRRARLLGHGVPALLSRGPPTLGNVGRQAAGRCRGARAVRRGARRAAPPPSLETPGKPPLASMNLQYRRRGVYAEWSCCSSESALLSGPGRARSGGAEVRRLGADHQPRQPRPRSVRGQRRPSAARRAARYTCRERPDLVELVKPCRGGCPRARRGAAV